MEQVLFNQELRTEITIRKKEVDGFYVHVMSTEDGVVVKLSSENTEDGEECGIQVDCTDARDAVQSLNAIAMACGLAAEAIVIQTGVETQVIMNNHEMLQKTYNTKERFEFINRRRTENIDDSSANIRAGR